MYMKVYVIGLKKVEETITLILFNFRSHLLTIEGCEIECFIFIVLFALLCLDE